MRSSASAARRLRRTAFRWENRTPEEVRGYFLVDDLVMARALRGASDGVRGHELPFAIYRFGWFA